MFPEKRDVCLKAFLTKTKRVVLTKCFDPRLDLSRQDGSWPKDLAQRLSLSSVSRKRGICPKGFFDKDQEGCFD